MGSSFAIGINPFVLVGEPSLYPGLPGLELSAYPRLSDLVVSGMAIFFYYACLSSFCIFYLESCSFFRGSPFFLVLNISCSNF